MREKTLPETKTDITSTRQIILKEISFHDVQNQAIISIPKGCWNWLNGFSYGYRRHGCWQPLVLTYTGLEMCVYLMNVRTGLFVEIYDLANGFHELNKCLVTFF